MSHAPKQTFTVLRVALGYGRAWSRGMASRAKRRRPTTRRTKLWSTVWTTRWPWRTPRRPRTRSPATATTSRTTTSTVRSSAPLRRDPSAVPPSVRQTCNARSTREEKDLGVFPSRVPSRRNRKRKTRAGREQVALSARASPSPAPFPAEDGNNGAGKSCLNEV